MNRKKFEKEQPDLRKQGIKDIKLLNMKRTDFFEDSRYWQLKQPEGVLFYPNLT